MTGAPGEGGSRDLQDVDALITDRYLDSILAAHGRGADAGPIPPDVIPARDIRLAIEHLTRDLPRFHPSFQFEEALAARLAEAAARMRLPLAAGGEEAGTSSACPRDGRTWRTVMRTWTCFPATPGRRSAARCSSVAR